MPHVRTDVRARIAQVKGFLKRWAITTVAVLVAEFVVPEAGNYVIVDHEFADAQKGAFGLLKAGMAPGDPASGH